MIHQQRIMSALDMLCFLTGGSFAAMGNIAQAAHQLYQAHDEQEGDIGILTSYLSAVYVSVNEVLRVSREIDLDATVHAAEQALSNIMSARQVGDNESVLSRGNAERLIWNLNRTVENFSSQLQSRIVMIIGSKNAKYIASDEPPFGQEVDDKLASAGEEISEAAKCLALQRFTATVFHLMRAMEIAVAKASQKLNSKIDTEKPWGIILSDMSRSIDALPKGAEKNQWSEVHSLLYHVKQAWRNDTMHPKKTYTEEQAQTLFDAVRSFLLSLCPLI